MCGRYRRTTSEEELARLYHIPIPPQRDLSISWNIAPNQDVLVIRYNPKAKQRSLDSLRWGLIPYWAKDPKIAFKTINARAETVDSAPSYREAFKKRRCLIPADGFYEWRTIGGTKIPFAIAMKDDRPFVFAGLWEGWKDPGSDAILVHLRNNLVRLRLLHSHELLRQSLTVQSITIILRLHFCRWCCRPR
jgi:putative SOS response-associated peptidase YedK